MKRNRPVADGRGGRCKPSSAPCDTATAYRIGPGGRRQRDSRSKVHDSRKLVSRKRNYPAESWPELTPSRRHDSRLWNTVNLFWMRIDVVLSGPNTKYGSLQVRQRDDVHFYENKTKKTLTNKQNAANRSRLLC